LFHSIILVSNLSHSSIMSRFTMCSFLLVLTSAKLSPYSLFGWCVFLAWTYVLQFVIWFKCTFLPFPFFCVGATTSSTMKSARPTHNLRMNCVTYFAHMWIEMFIKVWCMQFLTSVFLYIFTCLQMLLFQILLIKDFLSSKQVQHFVNKDF
jgi:hypothetical protein